MRGLRHNVEDQNDRPVGLAIVMILTLGDDERLLLAVRAEKQHVAFHRQAFDGRQRKERFLTRRAASAFRFCGMLLQSIRYLAGCCSCCPPHQGAHGLGFRQAPVGARL